MRTTIPSAILPPLMAAVSLPTLPLLGQGSLTPPGAPAATMKSLAQIEPRMPISSAPITITNSGVYYLTTNLTVNSGTAITIAASGVTLDLNGFTIASTESPATGTGIFLDNGVSDVVVQNGHIRGGVTANSSGVFSGPGFSKGIDCSSSPPKNMLVQRVSVSGVLQSGIDLDLGKSITVDSCTVQTVGGSGILACLVKNSTAVDCGSDAIYGRQVIDCRAESIGNGNGIGADTVQNCYAVSKNLNGISATTVQNSYGLSFGGGNAGISTVTAQNCYGGSFATSGGYGIYGTNVENCNGFTGGFFSTPSPNGIGISADTATNCRGTGGASAGRGVLAKIATGCYGEGAWGIAADVANGCYGVSAASSGFGIKGNVVTGSQGNGFTGISANVANGCQGEGTSTGMSIAKSVENSYGTGPFMGISVGGGSGVANNCYGNASGVPNSTSFGIQARTAIGSFGQSTGTIGLSGSLLNSCSGIGSSLGTSASFKYNMP